MGERPSPSNTPCASSDEAVDLLPIGPRGGAPPRALPLHGQKPWPHGWVACRAGPPRRLGTWRRPGVRRSPTCRTLDPGAGGFPQPLARRRMALTRPQHRQTGRPMDPGLDLHARPPGQRLDRGKACPPSGRARAPRPGLERIGWTRRRRGPLDAGWTELVVGCPIRPGIQPRRQHGGTRRPSRGRILHPEVTLGVAAEKPRRRGQSGPAPRRSQPSPFGRSTSLRPSPQTPPYGGCRGGAKARATSGWRTSDGTPGTAAASRVRRPCRNRLDWAGRSAVRLATPGMRKATTSALASSGARTDSSGFP